MKNRHLLKIQDTKTLYIGQWCLSPLQSGHLSHSSPRTLSGRSLLTAAHTRSTFSCALLVADLAEHGSLSTDSQPSLNRSCHIFICSALITLTLKAFWIIRIVSAGECCSLTQNLMQTCCSTYSFSMWWWPHSTHTHSVVSTTPTD